MTNLTPIPARHSDLTGLLPEAALPTVAVRTSEEYDNPDWIAGLSRSKVTGLSVDGGLALAGPDGVLDQDPNFTRSNGINVIKTPNANGFVTQYHNVGEDSPSDFPLCVSYTGEFVNGVRDHIYTFGSHVDLTPSTHPVYSRNIENYFDWGDGINKTLEIHDNYKSIDRTVSYRTVNRAIYLDTHSYDEHYRCRDITWYGRLGTIPLLHLDTEDGDGGTVSIANDGSANPLRIDSPGPRLLLLNTGSTGGFSVNNIQLADAINTARSSPAMSLQGYYWNGTASVGTSISFQQVVVSPTSIYTRMITGGVSHYYQSDGKVGHNIPGLVYLTEQLVIPYGHYGMVRNDQGSTVKLIGLDTSNRVVVSGGGNGILMGAAFVSQNGGLLGATSSQRGILDARGTVWFGAAGSTHAIVNGADGVYINSDATNGAAANGIFFGHGRSTTSGGTTWLSLVMDSGKNRAIVTTPATAPTDSLLANGQVSFYLDESGNNLKVRVRYSDATLKTGTVALT